MVAARRAGVEPLKRLVVAAGVLGASVAVGATDPPRLGRRLAMATVVVTGLVERVESYDTGRVAVAHLRATETIKGKVDGGVARVVEMRDLPSVPALFDARGYVVAFLVPLRRNSYLGQTLPDGRYLEALGGRSGRIAADSAAGAAEVGAYVRRLADASREPEADPARRAQAVRARAFDALAARHRTLVEEGAAALGDVPDLATTLTASEQRRLEDSLARTDLPSRERSLLVRAVGAAGLAQLVPALAQIPAPDAAVLEASWEALAALGSAPTVAELRRRLEESDADVRGAAVRAVLGTGDVDAVPLAARVALDDPEPAVRRAAIEALGRSNLPGTLPVLEGAFRQADGELRQVAGRMILQHGGRPAAEALARLAVEAPAEAQRFATVLLLAAVEGRDDPLVERLRTTHPSPAVRDLLEHGIEVGH